MVKHLEILKETYKKLFIKSKKLNVSPHEQAIIRKKLFDDLFVDYANKNIDNDVTEAQLKEEYNLLVELIEKWEEEFEKA